MIPNTIMVLLLYCCEYIVITASLILIIFLRKGRFVRADADSHTPLGSNMEELLAVAAQAESGDEEGDSPTASVSEKGLDSTSSSYTPNHGLDLLEQAIQFDDEDSRLPPGKRMRRHTIV